MRLSEFVGVLAATGIPTYHEIAPKKPGKRYLVWQEYAGKQGYADNEPLLIRRYIQLDFYTAVELDPQLWVVLKALREAGVKYDFPESTYDTDLNCDRYIIECEIMTGKEE